MWAEDTHNDPLQLFHRSEECRFTVINFLFKPRWLAKLTQASNEPEPTDSTDGGKDSHHTRPVNTECLIQSTTYSGIETVIV